MSSPSSQSQIITSTQPQVAGKKGDLEVTVVEARNVNCKGHAVYCTAELVKVEKTHTKPVHTSTSKDLKWNHNITLDLMMLDGEELIIKLFYKRTTKKDKFLGQSQMKISALSLSKEAEWHFLTDKPEILSKQRPGPGDLKRSRSITQAVLKRKEKFVVTGEILYKLNFVHRLLKARSRLTIGSGSSAPPEYIPPAIAAQQQSFSSSRLMAPTSVSARLAAAQAGANGKEHEEYQEAPPADFSQTEEVIIDEALKEKHRMVKEKLETGERIVRNMTARIAQIEKTEGEEAAREEKVKLDTIKREMKELEKILEATKIEGTVGGAGLSGFFHGANPRDARKSVRYSVAINPNPSRNSMILNRPSSGAKQAPLQSALVRPGRTPSLSSGASVHHMPPTKPIPKTPEKFATPEEELRYLRMKSALLEQNNSILMQEVARLDRDLIRYQREEELNAREAKLREREERLLTLGLKSPRKGAPPSPRMGAGEDGAEGDAEEGYEDLFGDDEKYDMIVAKLEKLDKLDELLRKLDSMKMGGFAMGGGGGDSHDGRGYAELKVELEGLQAIIMDETNKYTQKQKEEANINYEKVSQEYQQTPEYKREVAAALEERRKKNEPLNKAALEKMLRVYTAEAVREEPLKERVKQNPELTLIGMDPKVILAKHQNDFQQYMLRNLNMDEMRAIRASLPKFRNDQKRQQDWTDGLENKIETTSKNPPKPPAPKKAAIKLKTKPAGGGGGDFLSELMAKRKQIN